MNPNSCGVMVHGISPVDGKRLIAQQKQERKITRRHAD
jgi:hypothetical protein